MSDHFYSPEYHSAVRKLEKYADGTRQFLTTDEALAVLDCLAGYDDLLATDTAMSARPASAPTSNR